jgi:hypothetical protein
MGGAIKILKMGKRGKQKMQSSSYFLFENVQMHSQLKWLDN